MLLLLNKLNFFLRDLKVKRFWLRVNKNKTQKLRKSYHEGSLFIGRQRKFTLHPFKRDWQLISNPFYKAGYSHPYMSILQVIHHSLTGNMKHQWAKLYNEKIQNKIKKSNEVYKYLRKNLKKKKIETTDAFTHVETIHKIVLVSNIHMHFYHGFGLFAVFTLLLQVCISNTWQNSLKLFSDCLTLSEENCSFFLQYFQYCFL